MRSKIHFFSVYKEIKLKGRSSSHRINMSRLPSSSFLLRYSSLAILCPAAIGLPWITRDDLSGNLVKLPAEASRVKATTAASSPINRRTTVKVNPRSRTVKLTLLVQTLLLSQDRDLIVRKRSAQTTIGIMRRIVGTTSSLRKTFIGLKFLIRRGRTSKLMS
jgi:hypothetical protein